MGTADGEGDKVRVEIRRRRESISAVRTVSKRWKKEKMVFLIDGIGRNAT